MQLMSIEDLAAYLCVSKRTIYKYIASGDCPPYIKLSRKNISFDRADVDAWLESKKVQPGPGGEAMNDLNLIDRARRVLKNAIGRGKLPLTPRAQAVLELAEKQACEDGSDLVGTEHILSGIVSEKECLGAGILKNLGVAPSDCYQHHEQLCKPSDQKGGGKAKPSEDIEKVIQCAYEQATRWGHTYIGAEHLLVGILLAGTGMGFQILTDLGITLEKVRDETAKLIVCRPMPTE
jgi:excisionase family DNA binding protein